MLLFRIALLFVYENTGLSSIDNPTSPFPVSRLNTKTIMVLLCVDVNKEKGDL